MGRDPFREVISGVDGPALHQATLDALSRAVAHPAVSQAGGWALQLGASCTAYNLTLAVCHLTAGFARLHCATPLLAPLWGCGSVAAASAAAGHVSRATLAALQEQQQQHQQQLLLLQQQQQQQRQQQKNRKHPAKGDGGGGAAAVGGEASGGGLGWLVGALRCLPGQLVGRWEVREAAVDALLGPLLFKALQQDFRRLLPSHLARPGAFGRAHVPTSASEYSTPAEKGQLAVLFGRDGCHHCGTRSNGVIGDHMPPYKVVREALAAREAAGGLERAVTRLAEWLRLPSASLTQVYFAQCRDCSARQAQLMRNGTRSTAITLTLPQLPLPPQLRLLPQLQLPLPPQLVLRAEGLWPPELVAHSLDRLALRPAWTAVLVGGRYTMG
ncbi:hypothetical protein Agub_g3608, partial [Astrephomene gubernaculifera]